MFVGIGTPCGWSKDSIHVRPPLLARQCVCGFSFFVVCRASMQCDSAWAFILMKGCRGLIWLGVRHRLVCWLRVQEKGCKNRARGGRTQCKKVSDVLEEKGWGEKSHGKRKSSDALFGGELCGSDIESCGCSRFLLCMTFSVLLVNALPAHP